MYIPPVPLPPLTIPSMVTTLPPLAFTSSTSSSSYSSRSFGSISWTGPGIPSFASQPAILREQASSTVDRLAYHLDDYEGLSEDWSFSQQAIHKQDLMHCYFRMGPFETVASWKKSLQIEMCAVADRISAEYRNLLSIEHQVDRFVIEKAGPVDLYLDVKAHIHRLKNALRSCHSYPASL